MTKKDYELIARIFRKNITTTDKLELSYNTPVVCTAMAKQFAAVLASENPRFDSDRFLDACGVTR